MSVRVRLAGIWQPEGPPGGVARLVQGLLRPAACAFGLGVAVRSRAYANGWRAIARAPLAVVSVGGLEAGGVGKTPLALELLRLASAAGLFPAILSRGYGTRGGGGARRVEFPSPADAAERFGDEPAWLAEQAQSCAAAGVWISRRRLEAALAAARAGARLAILDDGLQHRGLAREGEVVSLSGRAPLANGFLLPAGPLREPPRALARADRVVLSQCSPAEAGAARERIRRWLRPRAEVFSWRGGASLRALAGEAPRAGEAVVLVAGIAHPERLRGSLEILGHPVRRAHLHPDHHRFRAEEIASLSRGRERGVPHVFTAKDWMRLRGFAGPGGPLAGLERTAVLEQTLIWNEDDARESWTSWLGDCARRFAAGAPGVSR